jgi:hypothetical protein
MLKDPKASKAPSFQQIIWRKACSNLGILLNIGIQFADNRTTAYRSVQSFF